MAVDGGDELPAHFYFLVFLGLREEFGRDPFCRLLGEAEIMMKNLVNGILRYPIGHYKIPDGDTAIFLHFDISYESDGSCLLSAHVRLLSSLPRLLPPSPASLWRKFAFSLRPGHHRLEH